MRNQFVKRLAQMAERDPRIVLVTGDLGFGVLDEFARRFPKQFINAGVAEQQMTGLAVGLALEGRVVYTYSIGNFVFMRCLEQLRNDAAYHEANVNAVCVGGGFSYGALGVSHHATEDLAIVRAIPGMTVVCPCTRWEAEEATEAVAQRPGPGYLRLDKSAADEAARPGETFQLGRARRLREGRHLTLAACGGVMQEVLAAADELARRGVMCRVLSMHTLKPLDEDALEAAARETGGILTVEEHTVLGGLGGAVAETLLERGTPPRRFRRLGLRDQFSSVVGGQRYLRRTYGLDDQAIVRAAQQTLERPAAGLELPKAA